METKTHTPAARYSTKELAARLFQSEIRVRHFLMAAGIPHTKIGQSYVWDAGAVDRLLASLPKEPGR